MKLVEFFIFNCWNGDFMGERCKNCKKKMNCPELTHCSDECLFDEIKIKRSIEDMPSIDDWDSNPWV